MAEVDAAAPDPMETLIERAGAAVAREALDLLGGSYGRRVVVLAGKGNNGADGIAAARRLERRGVRVNIIDAADPPAMLPPADLVIDAGYGTGFKGNFVAPELYPGPDGDPPVLAVDIPSGVSGTNGSVSGRPWMATRTVTFAAYKPGLLFEPGASYCGDVRVADIGLDVGHRRIGLIESADLAVAVRNWSRPVNAHKWQRSCWIIGGSAPMPGAAYLAAAAALRAGCGYVRVSSPGAEPGDIVIPTEAVFYPVQGDSWGALVTDSVAQAHRFGAAVIGPGLGVDRQTVDQVARVIAEVDLPLVVDADGLRALAQAGPGPLRSRAGLPRASTVLTPHDGERAAFNHWSDADADADAGGAETRTGCDRIDDTVGLAGSSGATVLLKGPTTVVAAPAAGSAGGGAEVRLVRSGDQRLATAGTGDVLAGIIGALLAQGAPPLVAAAIGAELHGRASQRCSAQAMVAGDLIDAIASELADLAEWDQQ